MIDMNPGAKYDSFGNRNVETGLSYSLTQDPKFPQDIRGGTVKSRLQFVSQKLISGHFKQMYQMGGNQKLPTTIWVSDGTSPNGVLAGKQGDICYNGPSGHQFYCTGTTVWVQL